MPYEFTGIEMKSRNYHPPIAPPKLLRNRGRWSAGLESPTFSAENAPLETWIVRTLLFAGKPVEASLRDVQRRPEASRSDAELAGSKATEAAALNVTRARA
jgi:hypothetical protein